MDFLSRVCRLAYMTFTRQTSSFKLIMTHPKINLNMSSVSGDRLRSRLISPAMSQIVSDSVSDDFTYLSYIKRNACVHGYVHIGYPAMKMRWTGLGRCGVFAIPKDLSLLQ